MPLDKIVLTILNTLNDFLVPILSIIGSIIILIGRHREARRKSVPEIIHNATVSTVADWEEISKRREAVIADLTRDYERKIKELEEEKLVLMVRVDEAQRHIERQERFILGLQNMQSFKGPVKDD